MAAANFHLNWKEHHKDHGGKDDPDQCKICRRAAAAAWSGRLVAVRNGHHLFKRGLRTATPIPSELVTAFEK